MTHRHAWLRRSGLRLLCALALLSCSDASDPGDPGGDLTIEPVLPLEDQFVEATFEVSVKITAWQRPSSVTARVGEHGVALAYDPGAGVWKGVLNLGDTPSPTDQTIEYVAVDAAGDAHRDSVTVRLDRLPVVTILEPLDDAFVPRYLRVRATCADDAPDGCDRIVIGAWSGHGFGLAEASGEVIDEMVDLWEFVGSTWYDDAGILVSVRGLDRLRPDTVANGSYVARTVYVDDGPNLTPVASSGTGYLLDASATHLLAVDGGRLDSLGTDTLRLVDRTSGQSRVLHESPGQTTRQAVLFPGGVIFVVNDPLEGSSLMEWRNGASTVLETGVTYFRASGAYAIWTARGRLFRRELTSGTTVTIADGVPANDHDVASTGEVAWWSSEPYEIHLFHNGASEQLTADGDGALRNVLPRTDGTRVVYQRTGFPPTRAGTSILLSDQGGGVTLAQSTECTRDEDTRPDRDYAARNGWIAYLRWDDFWGCSLWRLSSSGEEDTPTGDAILPSDIELIGDSGEIIFLNYVDRYRVPVGGPPVRISSWIGRPLYIDGQLHLLMGSSLLRAN